MDPKTLDKISREHFKISTRGETTRFTPRSSRDCEDCGLSVVDRRVTYVVKYDYKMRQFWEKRCGECKQKTVVSSPLEDSQNK